MLQNAEATPSLLDQGPERKHRASSPPLGARLLRLLDKGNPRLEADKPEEANEGVTFMRDLKEAVSRRPATVERFTEQGTVLQISRLMPGEGDPLGGEVMSLVARRDTLVDADQIAACETQLAGALDAIRTTSRDRTPFEKHKIDERLVAEPIPAELHQKFQDKLLEAWQQHAIVTGDRKKAPPYTWSDWISTTTNDELLQFVRWHHDLITQAPDEQKCDDLAQSFDNFAGGLKEAVRQGRGIPGSDEIDPQVLANLTEVNTIDLVVPSPFEELLFTRDAFTFPRPGRPIIAIAGRTGFDPRHAVGHEAAHLLGNTDGHQVFNEVTVEEITHAARPELKEALYLPLEEVVKDIRQRAGVGLREQTACFAYRSPQTFGALVQENTGFDFMGHIEAIYAHQLNASPLIYSAAERTREIMDALFRHIDSKEQEVIRLRARSAAEHDFLIDLIAVVNREIVARRAAVA